MGAVRRGSAGIGGVSRSGRRWSAGGWLELWRAAVLVARRLVVIGLLAWCELAARVWRVSVEVVPAPPCTRALCARIAGTGSSARDRGMPRRGGLGRGTGSSGPQSRV